MAQQWSVVVIAEGPDNPFDLTSDFLTDLRARGNYDIVATSISPVSGVRNGEAKCGDNDNYSPCRDNDLPPTFDEILASLDGHDASVYAGRRG